MNHEGESLSIFLRMSDPVSKFLPGYLSRYTLIIASGYHVWIQNQPNKKLVDWPSTWEWLVLLLLKGWLVSFTFHYCRKHLPSVSFDKRLLLWLNGTHHSKLFVGYRKRSYLYGYECVLEPTSCYIHYDSIHLFKGSPTIGRKKTLPESKARGNDRTVPEHFFWAPWEFSFPWRTKTYPLNLFLEEVEEDHISMLLAFNY